MRVLATPYILKWEGEKLKEKEDMLRRGIIPFETEPDPENFPQIMGRVAAVIHSVEPAKKVLISFHFRSWMI